MKIEFTNVGLQPAGHTKARGLSAGRRERADVHRLVLAYHCALTLCEHIYCYAIAASNLTISFFLFFQRLSHFSIQ